MAGGASLGVLGFEAADPGLYGRLITNDAGDLEAIVEALPGLYGWVGVDFIMAEGMPMILEVNPRLTTSYCGLRAARGINPAQLLLDTLQGKALPPNDAFAAGEEYRLDLGTGR